MVSCYEAGGEGFWLDRWLKSKGMENQVIDSSSIEVNRRRRRRKTHIPHIESHIPHIA